MCTERADNLILFPPLWYSIPEMGSISINKRIYGQFLQMNPEIQRSELHSEAWINDKVGQIGGLPAWRQNRWPLSSREDVGKMHLLPKLRDPFSPPRTPSSAALCSTSSKHPHTKNKHISKLFACNSFSQMHILQYISKYPKNIERAPLHIVTICFTICSEKIKNNVVTANVCVKIKQKKG